jgi:hypothetical protein
LVGKKASRFPNAGLRGPAVLRDKSRAPRQFLARTVNTYRLSDGFLNEFFPDIQVKIDSVKIFVVHRSKSNLTSLACR